MSKVHTTIRHAALLIAVVVVLAAQRDHVERPTFLRSHRIWAAHDLIYFTVKVVPHARIKTILLEAWELQGDPQEPAENDFLSDFLTPLNPKKVALVRSSVEQAEPNRVTYRIEWKAGLDRGDYSVVAKLYLGSGLHVESAPYQIMVR